MSEPGAPAELPSWIADHSKLYLLPEFLETEADFIPLKPNIVHVGNLKTFVNFIVPVPESIDPAAFNTVVVWCEYFSQFITAAQYR